MKKVGVFVCHCGSNIAHSVDCAKVAEALKDFPNVAYSTDYKYMCSEPGQEMIQKAIKEKGLDRVVVCSCSPRMHENTVLLGTSRRYGKSYGKSDRFGENGCFKSLL